VLPLLVTEPPHKNRTRRHSLVDHHLVDLLADSHSPVAGVDSL